MCSFLSLSMYTKPWYFYSRLIEIGLCRVWGGGSEAAIGFGGERRRGKERGGG